MNDMNAFERQLAGLVRQAMRPPRPVDVAAIVAATTASAGRWSITTRRLRGGARPSLVGGGFSMFSAVKFAVAAAIVALCGGFLLSGVLNTQQSEELVPAAETTSASPLSATLEPSGAQRVVRGVSIDEESFVALVRDGRGDVWALGDGLMRFGVDDGTLALAEEWSLADDATFATGTIAPARDGGVWLGGPTIRRFDGFRFATTIAAPPGDVFELAEASDGALWATVEQGGLPYGTVWRWDGSSWTDMQAGHVLGGLSVDDEGRVWALLGTYPGPRIEGVAVWDDGSWHAYGPEDHRLLTAGNYGSLEVAPAGEAYVRTAGSLLMFDGSAWAEVEDGAISGEWDISVGPDGTLWLETVDGIYTRPPGGVLEPVEGLPDGWTDALAFETANPVFEALEGGVVIATSEGLSQVHDGRVTPIWSPQSSRSPQLALTQYPLGDVLATGSEVWVSDDEGVWLCPMPPVPSGCRVTSEGWLQAPMIEPPALTQAPDGTLWSTGANGTARLVGARWDVISRAPGQAVTVGPDGTVWVLESDGAGLTAWSEAESGWVADHHPADEQPHDVTWMAILPDGSLLAHEGGWLPLLRFDGSTWTTELEDEVGGRPLESVLDADVDADGHLWVLWSEPTQDEDRLRIFSTARLDEDGWTAFDVPAAWLQGLVAGPDGTAWLGSDDGLYRFSGDAWVPAGFEGSYVAPLDATADGAVWFTDYRGLYRLPPP